MKPRSTGRSGEKEEGWVEVRMRGKSANGAPDCVGSDMRAHGSGLCACEAYGRPSRQVVPVNTIITISTVNRAV